MSKEQELTDTPVESEDQEVVEPVVENVAPDIETQNATDEQPAVSIEELQKELHKAQQKAEENWDKAVRAQAEMDNLKKRTQRDLENAHKFALENFTKELLTVIDSLELGIQACTGDNPEVTKLREGSELTLKQFNAVFNKFNIEAIDPVGLPFNPEHHQAMSMQPTTEFAANTVMNVFQKGYLLNDRLVRPAMVVVAKAPEASPNIDEQA